MAKWLDSFAREAPGEGLYMKSKAEWHCAATSLGNMADYLSDSEDSYPVCGVVTWQIVHPERRDRLVQDIWFEEYRDRRLVLHGFSDGPKQMNADEVPNKFLKELSEGGVKPYLKLSCLVPQTSSYQLHVVSFPTDTFRAAALRCDQRFDEIKQRLRKLLE